MTPHRAPIDHRSAWPGRVGWAGAVVLLLFGGLLWVAVHQRRAVVEAAGRLERFRSLRLALARGHLQWSHDARAGVDAAGAHGAAEVAAALASLRLAAAALAPEAESAELRAGLDGAAEVLLGHLEAGRSPGEAVVQDAFRVFDLDAERLEAQSRVDLEARAARVDRGALLTTSAALALLAIVLLVAARRHRRDVRVGREQEAALRLFRALIDQTTDHIEVVDPETGRFLDVNQGMCARLGYTRAELLGMRVFDVAAVTEAQWLALRDVARAQGRLRGEGVHRRKDGAEVRVEWDAAWVTLEREYFVAIARDVGPRQAAERALDEERGRLEWIARTSPGAVYSFREGPHGEASFTYASPRFESLFGVSAEAARADASQVLRGIHADDLHRVRAVTAASRRDLSPWRTEFRFHHPERGVIWLEGHSMPLSDPEGGVTWHGVLTDVTERKASEETIRSQQRLLLQMERSAQAGGWEVDLRTGQAQ
jgi:PAS domain S-box-containing protein